MHSKIDTTRREEGRSCLGVWVKRERAKKTEIALLPKRKRRRCCGKY